MQLEAAHAVEITKLMDYVDKKEDPLIQVVRTHQHNTDSAVWETARCLKMEVQKETRKMKDSIAEKTKERWHGKRMHGELPRNLDEKPLDIEQSYCYILITNLMHWLLFIHKILFFSTCFESQVLIFRRIQLYTCSIWCCHYLWEFLVACRYTAWVRTQAVYRQATRNSHR